METTSVENNMLKGPLQMPEPITAFSLQPQEYTIEVRLKAIRAVCFILEDSCHTFANNYLAYEEDSSWTYKTVPSWLDFLQKAYNKLPPSVTGHISEGSVVTLREALAGARALVHVEMLKSQQTLLTISRGMDYAILLAVALRDPYRAGLLGRIREERSEEHTSELQSQD